jgi:hypothetical protein
MNVNHIYEAGKSGCPGKGIYQGSRCSVRINKAERASTGEQGLFLATFKKCFLKYQWHEE